VTVSDIDALESEIRIDGAPEAVFAYLVDPDKMVRWMGAHAESDPRPSGTVPPGAPLSASTWVERTGLSEPMPMPAPGGPTTVRGRGG
jgi:hypothetical protein